MNKTIPDSSYARKLRQSNLINTNVTVFLEVFNEEDRIESCLKSFAWADELIVFDKQSTDRTREISKKYATEIIIVPCTQASENIIQNIYGRDSCEWVFFPTASSLIHPNLVDEIIKLTSNSSFEYDVIGMPYGKYSFGIRSKNSPWEDPRKYTLIRRSVLKLSTKLHNEIGYISDRIYKMPFMASDEVLYHCTNKDADDYFRRQIRYIKYEAEYDKSLGCNQALKQSFIGILKAIFMVLFRRRSFLLGTDGIPMSLAHISYSVIKFIYDWDSHRENGNTIYPVLRNKLDDLWDKRNIG